MSSRRPLYHSYAWAYDAIVANPGGPTVEAVGRVFSDHGLGAGAPVVDAGCGTGRHAIGLAGAGFSVVGIDRSLELIEQARARAGRERSSATFEQGDLCTWRPDRSCAGVLCRGVLNDFLVEGERRRALAGLAGMLGSGGVLVADVREWTASAARYAERPLIERTVETVRGPLTFRVDASLEPEARILRLHETVSLGEQTEDFDFAMQCWLPDELETGLRGAGFDRIELSEGDRLRAVAVRSP